MWRGSFNLTQKSDRKILHDISNAQLNLPFPSKEIAKEGICGYALDNASKDQNQSILEWRINKQDAQLATPVSISMSSRLSASASTPSAAKDFNDTTFYKDASPKQSTYVKDIIDFIDQVGSILDKSTHDQSTVEELLCFMDMAADKIKVIQRPQSPNPARPPLHPKRENS
jgi:hypothetical protein